MHLGRRPDPPARAELKAFREKAQPLLNHRVLWFTDEQRQVIGQAFAEVVRDNQFTCYACAILPNHAHLLVRRHAMKGESMIHLLRKRSQEALLPQMPDNHPVWTASPLVFFKSTADHIRACIDYILANYEKHHIAMDNWPFVTPYDGWGEF